MQSGDYNCATARNLDPQMQPIIPGSRNTGSLWPAAGAANLLRVSRATRADSHNTGMYGGWFLFWDWLMGTDQTYMKHLGKNREKLGFRRVIWRLRGQVGGKEE